MVGRIHTTTAGNSEISVPLIQMNALMGLLSDVLADALIESPFDSTTTPKTIRAFNKLMWIQNDFVNRHDVDEGQQ
ncbi:MAG: protoglobin domain-containing protein [Planctomycetota bacterium]|nr:protoglobin domain-containing protein [Planctomycetota bacterium]MDA1166576.1 protoglobin domain-containing protein [Planctomycetota bacterium]